jgi:hypothetical protein
MDGHTYRLVRPFKLEVNMREVPTCTCSANCAEVGDHWSVRDIREVLGRELADADAIRVLIRVVDR